VRISLDYKLKGRCKAWVSADDGGVILHTPRSVFFRDLPNRLSFTPRNRQRNYADDEALENQGTKKKKRKVSETVDVRHSRKKITCRMGKYLGQ